jgi:hypothetical protein
MDVTFNSYQLNISLDVNLFEIIKSTFQTKKQLPQTIKELKFLYLMMLKNITNVKFITSTRIKTTRCKNKRHI